jgi:hypothetical protein
VTAPSTTSIVGYARNRGISEVLHFTTSRGLVGIFDKRAVLCRDRLDADQRLAAIRTPNCEDRLKDVEWMGFVNLSLSRVNKWMFEKSRGWHEQDGIWWAVLAFDVELLGEKGVYFTTTNNTYSSVVRRDAGVDGLADLFTDGIPWGYHGSKKWRRADMPDWFTTDPQAEVLYPDAVPLRRLEHIYVPESEHIDDIAGLVASFPQVPPVPVSCAPGIFT